MSNRTDIPSYDWDRHFRIRDDINHLDLYYLSLTEETALSPENSGHDLIEEFTLAAGDQGRRPLSVSYQRISAAVERMVTLADHHARLSLKRSSSIRTHSQDMARFFNDGEFSLLSETELSMRSAQLYDLYDTMVVGHILYNNGETVYQDDGVWKQACTAMAEDIRIFQGNIQNSFAVAANRRNITLPDADRALQDFMRSQEKLAADALEHADIQAQMVEECLRLAALIQGLPDSYREQMTARMDNFIDLAGPLIIMAYFALEEAADCRQSAHLSRDIKKPVFKLAYP